ncbi:MAG: Sec-independent protein translocase protein TatB [Alphaproteobacteria bacterium]|nr:Sec-independent protein translocase protein TatB [Alphaproteobacteria bacterium]MBU1278075.1 Sec-independent protein translocase protein TatB [Alphaproteobacteria bacterium]MBU1574901.1 Sec-independent protein translocase protein TatB [Alphaproteobacteria bacterium]MBU1829782.1 Sec-independent protein translocase protein TatB [Alphaproteobacteria bacterium]MBU2078953.1 Sec-independent protein translocase protein TatB [Alphaproteobacteria bacterium]
MSAIVMPSIPLFFDMGMSELLVIGVVALIVVGPKDLPGMFRTLGRFTAKAKSMAREFSRAMESAADESGIKEATDAFKGATNPKKFGLDKLNDAASTFEKWDPLKSSDGKAAPKTTALQKDELSPERAEAAKKISESAAKKATERKAAEAAEAEAAAAPAKATAVKKPVAKKPAAKKPAPKTTAAKTAAKPTAKSTAAKPAAAKKATAPKATPKKAAAKPAKMSTSDEGEA